MALARLANPSEAFCGVEKGWAASVRLVLRVATAQSHALGVDGYATKSVWFTTRKIDETGKTPCGTDCPESVDTHWSEVCFWKR